MTQNMLRHVSLDGYTLQMWDTGKTDSMHKTRIRYEFKTPEGTVLFAGDDFRCSPLDAIDSDNCVRALLSFLTLRPGDTDHEYFADYTPEQMAYAQGDAERHQLFAMEDDNDETYQFEDVEE